MSLPPRTLRHWRTQLADGHVTSRQLTEMALDAAQYGSEASKSFLVVHTAAARGTADAVDAQRAAGLPLPPLAGIPLSIKDLFDEAGQVTCGGSSVLRDAAPASADSAVVSRLRAAGAVIVGRTNLVEFAYSGLGLNPHHGTPRNPWDRAVGRIPGGSSSGAAISVTDGMAAAAIGTDTGGSVRIPSALCGLAGFKPTASRVSMEGVLPLSPSLDSIGSLAWSAACCAQLDAVLSSKMPMGLRSAGLAGRRFAVPRTLVFDGADREVAAAFERAAMRLSSAGARLVEVDVPEFEQLAAINSKGGLIAAEAWAWHERLLRERGDEYDPRVALRIRRGASITPADHAAAQAARQRWIASVTQRLAGFDALLMPTVPVVAPTIAEVDASDEAYGSANLLMLRNPTLINFLDGCALSVPCHEPGDAPVGLMIAGTRGQDATVLALGAAIEEAIGGDAASRAGDL